MASKVTVIAIDGPVAAGKTVVGKELAHRLGFKYLDTGIMYRAVGWLARRNNLAKDDSMAIGKLAEGCDIRLEGQDNERVIVDGRVLSAELIDPEVSRWASVVAVIPAVRRSMVKLQRSIAVEGSIVMVGRDIGTVVLPNADLKIFMTASVKERARRRWRDQVNQGSKIDFDQVLQETHERDQRDTTREDSPLIPASDAITINTDGWSIGQAVESIVERLKLKAEK